ncbi:phosphatidylinositol-glycan biosynthesis class S protein-domain-containing protein [Phlebopus sp. FC_14]|nr:phosphatidylinositol-glycan biosynthesis class S protein-domain-containing protein [Phlebopus sp. FC_14]
MSVVNHGLKDPQRLSFESSKTRRLVLGSYWFIIVAALPFWWHLTSIQRIALPSNHVRSQLDRKPVFSVDVRIDTSTFQTKALGLSRELNQLLSPSSQFSPECDAKARLYHQAVTMNIAEMESSVYTVILDDVTAIRHPRQLLVSPEDASSGGRILSNLLAPQTTPFQAQRVAQYSQRYRLSFTLLNENAASDRSASSWDIEAVIAGMSSPLPYYCLSPILSRLTALHNFTVESQVQFHAPLAFEPSQLVVANQTLRGLTAEDLTIFVNSAEWTLSSSVSNDPVLHFVLFIPSAALQPLHIIDTQGKCSLTGENSFLLPQWGGIYILNKHVDAAMMHLSAVDLVPVFSTFANQLSTLLGVPSLPDGIKSEDSAPLSSWQLDALLRYRAMENFLGSQQTLNSIVKLVDQIENMPVDQNVRVDVHDALAALEQAYRSTVGSPVTSLRWSSEALSLASHAFFNPGMLALLYFPAEHKYAVYTPLFASIAVPLIVALVREAYTWRRERRNAVHG